MNNTLKGSLDLLQLIRYKQIYVRDLIHIKLLSDKTGFKIRSGNGNELSYPNYIWLTVKTDMRVYCISMFTNEIDLKTRNIHTRIGYIQFCRYEPSNDQCEVKHCTHKRDNNCYAIQIGYPETSKCHKTVEIRKSKSAKLGKTRYSGFTTDTVLTSSDVEELVDSFYRFLINSGEDEKQFAKILAARM